MCVNISVRQLMAAGLAQAVATALTNTSTDSSLLTLEVTEGVFAQDERRAVIVLRELKEIGVKLALDDFGTGYSSLGYLNAMPIDIIKIDRSFVSKLTEEPGTREIVTAIVGLAHGLGMTVVAEGVETAQQHQELTRLGCDLCQGFYFAKPMLAELMDPLIQTQADGGTTCLPASRPVVAAAI